MAENFCKPIMLILKPLIAFNEETPPLTMLTTMPKSTIARTQGSEVSKTVLKNISHVTLDGLECIPVPILRRMWQDLNKRSVINLHTWKMFSKLIHHDDHATLNLFRYRQAIQTPVPSLEVYTKPVISETFDFLTNLSITTAFSIPDLVRLSLIKNLGSLEIVNPQEQNTDTGATPFAVGVGDRIIRAWHEAAVKDGAFPVLRILKLRNFKALTSKSLVYLNSFPSLAVFDVAGCGFALESKIDAHRLGWRVTVDGDILGLLEAACVERAVLMQGPLGLPSVSLGEEGPVDANIFMQIRPIRRPCALQLIDNTHVNMIPRAEIPKFITRSDPPAPKTSHRPGKLYNRMYYDLDQVHARNPNKHIKKHAWDVLDTLVYSKTRALETWEFRTLTSFCKVGELRNDKDLAKAGIDIGDQAVVGKDLISSVPVVSLRLGPSPNTPSSPFLRNELHRPFYESMHGDPVASSLKYTWKDDTSSKKPRGLCFIRINVPSKEKQSTESRVPDVPASTLSDGDSARSFSMKPSEGPLGMPSHWHVKRVRSARAIRQKKKQKLADVLSSFM
ncbi:succinyl-3-ketoacid-coenzyme a transferase protein [Rutstroemia sp. NJR-2017a BBW]|nr:succinyl-3-ketoacid-coenzyme a transferase protein [Rutstroemia sp. NJR-2017a BBW]